VRDLAQATSSAPSPDAPVAPDLEALDATGVLAHAVGAHQPRLTLLCSFQKEESVLVDELIRLVGDPKVLDIVTIDTGVLFPETLSTWRAFEERYGIDVRVEDATSPDGVAWTAERCCGDLKVAALERSLSDTDAWITGIRREQAPTRANARKVEWDQQRGIWKYNPLADWTEKDLWARIVERDLPYHPLHDQGYSSIGCAPCTQPGSGREGRWASSEKTECGLHVIPSGATS
jgi:phosphoadenosine phosphosulfate reductase